MDQPRVPAGSPEGGQFASKGFSLSGPFVPGVSGVGYGVYAGRDAAIRKITRENGRELGVEDIAKLAGALPGSRIHDIEIDGGTVGVTVNFLGPDGKETGGNSRAIYLESGTIYNASMHLGKEHQRQGTGAKMLHQQVTAAVKLGFKRIDTFAAGGPGEPSNGYSTWPRLGFLPRGTDGKVPINVVKTVPGPLWDPPPINPNSPKTRMSHKSVPTIINMARMMSTETGRKWWAANGEAHSATFDLSEGSISRRVLSAYVKEKGWD